jgi:hypothetical protein
MASYVADIHKPTYYTSPYSSSDTTTDNLIPRVRPYSGWASYKNNKSGQFNRSLCWTCGQAQSFPQTPGTYPLNIDNRPVIQLPTEHQKNTLNKEYQQYIQRRIDNYPGNWNGYYVNYLNEECGSIYPKRYVKGFWPDEQKQVTNTPTQGFSTYPDTSIEMTNAPRRC